MKVFNKNHKNAIILAAGYGMRMVPINNTIPKGLLQVQNECLIERLIKQMHKVEIHEIYVIVGFMKEKFAYLEKSFNVKLIENPEFDTKNNLHSLKLASNKICNTYIVPSDIWCEKNPFNKDERNSWYMYNQNNENQAENAMIGIAYIQENDAQKIQAKINQLVKNPDYDDKFWEEAIYEKHKKIISLPIRMVSADDVKEINTYEQLRDLDCNCIQLKSNAISVIAKALNVSEDKIVNITVLKKGMTNRSFLFECNDKKYIMRIPGEGTDCLINRKEEADVYSKIASLKLCDEIIYINPENGYKITEYIEGARVCDPENDEDLKKCMAKLKSFHNLNLQVDHEFNIFGQIEFYESLWDGKKSVYKDYEKTKKRVLSLKSFIKQNIECKTLTHIDAVPDNFLFFKNDDGSEIFDANSGVSKNDCSEKQGFEKQSSDAENVRLIDWEYAGMQDPHVDIAMFSIYSFYNKKQIDKLINIYFDGAVEPKIVAKIYCYVAVCGFLWSNWCEYKRSLGVDFGEYAVRQYRYAKDFYKIAMHKIKEIKKRK